MFDAEALKRYTTSEKGSTSIVAVPIGDWPGVLTDRMEFRQSAGKKDPSKMYTFFDIDILVDSPEVRELTKRDRPTVRYSCIVDLTADGTRLDMSPGKNIQLNRLRDAVGQNNGQAWSPEMLVGRPVRVKVKHTPSTQNPGDAFAEAEAVAPL